MAIMDVGGRTDRCWRVGEAMDRVIQGNRKRLRASMRRGGWGGINGKPLPRSKSVDPLCFIPQDCIPQTPGHPTSKVEADEVGR